MSNTTSPIFFAISPSTSGTISITGSIVPSTPEPTRGGRTLPKSQDYEGAVYAHIQALRALSKTRVNTTEIAKALNISVPTVNEAIRSMESKGVKIL